MADFDLAAHQRDRIRELDRRCTMLEAEERRLYRILALALRVATREGQCDPSELLGALCAIDGTEPARPAWVDEHEREQADAETARLVQLLRETDPDRMAQELSRAA